MFRREGPINPTGNIDNIDIPKEPNHLADLIEFVKHSVILEEDEKMGIIENCQTAHAAELREIATHKEHEAVDPKSAKAINLQHLSVLLKNAADFLDRNNTELEPSEALEKARAIYAEALEESQSQALTQFINDRIANKQSTSGGKDLSDSAILHDLIEAYQESGSKPAILIGFHERLGNLSELRRLTSLAINRFRAYELVRTHAMETERAAASDVAHREIFISSANRDLVAAEEMRQQYAILLKAVEVLQSTPS